ncbi:MAG: ATP-dependent DNA helicase RecG [Acidobacteria bacterium]|nr:ATP-dependent DNA helicase RecG [Acidobacteriota bacterium]
MELTTSIQYIKGVGPKRAAALEKAGIRTVEDFLFYKPLRYEDRRAFKEIGSLRQGDVATVSGKVWTARLYGVPRRGLSVLEMVVRDESGSIVVKFFNQPYLRDQFQKGRRMVLFGEVRWDDYSGKLALLNPEFELLDEARDAQIHTGRVVPIYRKLGDMKTKALRNIAHAVVENLPGGSFDPLPEDIRQRHSLLPRLRALAELHFPVVGADGASALALYNEGRSAAHRRMILEEFFVLQVGLQLLRVQRAVEIKRRKYAVDDRIREAVKRILPFHPTAAQKRALKEIVEDLCSRKPMNRLLQGDVGSGKTIVGLQAAVVAIENGYQVAWMAPTEILAEQHFLSIKRLLARSAYGVALLTSAVRKAEKEKLKRAIAAGSVHLVVGTHALIQEDVAFRDLGLAIIDEQHRFGVLQRSSLKEKGLDPDTLVMTATPIPRSLALTVYGDLDLSVIDQLPPGRQPIRTLLKPSDQRQEVYRIVAGEVQRGHQVYVVYPLVEESERKDLKAATQMANHLADRIFPGLRVGLLHGRLKSPQKEEVMSRFAQGELDILVATTVIEVGIDVPNATLMVIEHAERFGLAQLHQLRGRVGRGRATSSCILVVELPVSEEAGRRLQTLCDTCDGFRIAEVDLELRGPGDFAGVRQWGIPQFGFGNIVRDRDLLELARQEAQRFVARSVEGRFSASDQAVLQHLRHRWREKMGLALVG